jgi:hypothetical protein
MQKTRKHYAGSENNSPHLIQGKGAILVTGTVEILHQKIRKRSMGIRRVAGLTLNRLLMTAGYST